jgi:hypothetical protein
MRYPTNDDTLVELLGTKVYRSVLRVPLQDLEQNVYQIIARKNKGCDLYQVEEFWTKLNTFKIPEIDVCRTQILPTNWGKGLTKNPNFPNEYLTLLV